MIFGAMLGIIQGTHLHLSTPLRDDYGHIFLKVLQLYWVLFMFGQTKVENLHFCQVSQN